MEMLLVAGLYLFVVLVAFSFMFQRVRWRRRRRLGRKHLGFYPTSTSLGNALHELQSIAEPPAKYVIAEMLDEEDEAEDKEPGSPASPRVHLLRQAARIRRGEHLERLTAITEKQSVEGAQRVVSKRWTYAARINADSLRECQTNNHG